MKNLVQLDSSGHAFTTTLIVSEGVGTEHRAVMKLLDSHIKRDAFSALEVRKKKAKGSGKPTRYYELNELQATFLITLMKNSEIVVNFKETLIKEFFKMRLELSRIASNQSNAQWLEQRNSGKIARRIETDVIQKFIDYAKRQGGSEKGCDMYYSNLSTMENKALFIVERKYPNLRNVLGITDLSTIQNADHIVSKALSDGMIDSLHYKEIYKLAKERVEMFAELRGKSVISNLLVKEKQNAINSNTHPSQT